MKLSSATGLKYGTKILVAANAPTSISAHLPKCGAIALVAVSAPTVFNPAPLAIDGTHLLVPAFVNNNSNATGLKYGAPASADAYVPFNLSSAPGLRSGATLSADAYVNLNSAPGPKSGATLSANACASNSPVARNDLAASGNSGVGLHVLAYVRTVLPEVFPQIPLAAVKLSVLKEMPTRPLEETPKPAIKTEEQPVEMETMEALWSLTQVT